MKYALFCAITFVAVVFGVVSESQRDRITGLELKLSQIMSHSSLLDIAFEKQKEENAKKKVMLKKCSRELPDYECWGLLYR